MFGYVIPNQAALDDEAKARYRTAYCGLCRRIGALHGLRGRLTLSYDLTFLDLLLSSLYEGESECITGSGHCPIHPIRKINWRHSGPTDYCADMSVAPPINGTTTTACWASASKNCWTPLLKPPHSAGPDSATPSAPASTGWLSWKPRAAKTSTLCRAASAS